MKSKMFYSVEDGEELCVLDVSFVFHTKSGTINKHCKGSSNIESFSVAVQTTKKIPKKNSFF